MTPNSNPSMARNGTLMLVAALLCFALFFANVTVGAFGGGVFLSDIAEMLTLFVACVFFIVGVLLREAVEKSVSKTEDNCAP